MGALRAATVLAGFAGLTIPLMPLQAVLVRISPSHARRLPHWYHKQLCKLLGIRINIEGEIAHDKPLLLIANHSSWLDIPVMSAIAPVSFIAKKEVSNWPGVSLLARLQRTVFVDRERRTSVKQTTSDLKERLAQGDTLLLFAEGTSSDGARLLPFKSALFAAALGHNIGRKPARSRESEHPAFVQTVTVAYTHLHGVPIGYAERPIVGWYGDMEMLSHAWQLLKFGPIDVEARVGKPIAIGEFADRKAITQATENEIGENLARLLRYKQPNETVKVTPPSKSWNKRPSVKQTPSKQWT